MASIDDPGLPGNLPADTLTWRRGGRGGEGECPELPGNLRIP